MDLKTKLSRWTRKMQDRTDSFLIFGVIWSVLMRIAVSRWPYSGQGKPPMFGDFEAHRHWMEITVNLPAKEWYVNSSSNDLQYWGLDYPPLSAYQSLICGYIARWINPEWVALYESRGYESYELQIFMRFTVLILEFVFFTVPLVFYWLLIPHPWNARDRAVAAVLVLTYPGFIMIDHGHFQYNTVCFGLVLMALLCMRFKQDVLGACMFTLALHYKHMSLYYALPVFFHLLRTCFELVPKQGVFKFIKLALAVIVVSAACWAPFLQDLTLPVQVFRRLFPVDRGIYEDKVANIWYCISIVLKLKDRIAQEHLLTLSALCTFSAVLPTSYSLLKKPKRQRVDPHRDLLYALASSSLAFFLLSYQVHEKTILFVAFPVMLLVEQEPIASAWFSTISVFSLAPLMLKDGILSLLMTVLSISVASFWAGYEQFYDPHGRTRSILGLMLLSMTGCIVLVIGMVTTAPPEQYPDLHMLLNCVYSCAHFVGFAIYFAWKQLYVPKPADEVAAKKE